MSVEAKLDPQEDINLNPAHILKEIEDAGKSAVDSAEKAVDSAKNAALGAITKAEKSAVDAITKAGNEELKAFHDALSELDAVKQQIAQAEHDITDVADKALQKVLDSLEKAAAKVAQDVLTDVCDLIDDFEKAGIEGPSFDVQLGVVSCSIEDPVGRVAALRDAIKDGVHGYTEIQDVVNIIVPDSVTIEFSAEIEFLVVRSNALEAGVSITVTRDDLEAALQLFLTRIGLL